MVLIIKNEVLIMKFKLMLLIGLVSLMIVVAGCGENNSRECEKYRGRRKSCDEEC